MILEVSKEWLTRWKTVCATSTDTLEGIAAQLDDLSARQDALTASAIRQIASQLRDLHRNIQSASQPF